MPNHFLGLPILIPDPIVRGREDIDFPLSPQSPVDIHAGEGGPSADVSPCSPGPGAPFDLSAHLYGVKP